MPTKKLKIAIVGNRLFTKFELVEAFLNTLNPNVTIISGGAKGVDTRAIESAKKRGLKTKEYLPDFTDCTSKHQRIKAYYSRNQKVVDSADQIAAFVVQNTGGTWDTIHRAQKALKPVKIFWQSGKVT